MTEKQMVFHLKVGGGGHYVSIQFLWVTVSMLESLTSMWFYQKIYENE